MQSAPSQQSAALMHAALGSAQHAPSRHSPPLSHAVPPQQRSRAWPQRSIGGSESGAGWSKGMSSKVGMSLPFGWSNTNPPSRSAVEPLAHAPRATTAASAM